MYKKLFLSTCVLMFLTANDTIAAPGSISASGTFSTGNSVTISGTGFGTKSPAAPLLWDTFESGTVGNAIQNVSAVVGAWETGVGSDNVFYSSTSNYAGSRAARHNFRTAGGLYNSSLSLNDESYTVLYVDMKQRVPDAVYSGNYKPWRFYGGNDYYQVLAGYGCSAGVPYAGIATYDDPYNVVTWDMDTEGITGGWDHYQVFYKESTGGVADGAALQVKNGVNDGGSLTMQTRNTGSTRHINQIRLGHFMETGTRDGCTIPESVDTYTDNVYIDTTWARVELGNASTYADSTHREIQIPSAWSDTSATITVNQGTFTSGQTAYLYVFDSTGAVNATGYAVEIGGTATVTCYPDTDEDTYGDINDAGTSMETCNAGEVTNHTDCNDSSATINPGATETCGDSIDQDCSGADLACAVAGGMQVGAGSMQINTSSNTPVTPGQ